MSCWWVVSNMTCFTPRHFALCLISHFGKSKLIFRELFRTAAAYFLTTKQFNWEKYMCERIDVKWRKNITLPHLTSTKSHALWKLGHEKNEWIYLAQTLYLIFRLKSLPHSSAAWIIEVCGICKSSTGVKQYDSSINKWKFLVWLMLTIIKRTFWGRATCLSLHCCNCFCKGVCLYFEGREFFIYAMLPQTKEMAKVTQRSSTSNPFKNSRRILY